MVRTILVCLLSLTALYAQNNSTNPNLPPPAATAETQRFSLDGSGRSEYICTALQQNVNSIFALTAGASLQPRKQASAAVVTLTQIVDSVSTATITFSGAHGLSPGDYITISGATVDTDLNGSYTVATVGSSTTLTITTANVTDATYTDATLVVSTFSPRGLDLVWSIQKMFYTGTNTIPDRVLYVRANSTMQYSCDDRTSY